MTTTSTPQRPVWLFVSALFAVTALIAVFRLSDVADHGTTSWWIWPVAVLGFAAGDATVVRVHFRSETTAFTFVELPLFLAAIYISPLAVLVTLAAGVAV